MDTSCAVGIVLQSAIPPSLMAYMLEGCFVFECKCEDVQSTGESFASGGGILSLFGDHPHRGRGVDLALWHHSWCQNNLQWRQAQISGATVWLGSCYMIHI